MVCKSAPPAPGACHGFEHAQPVRGPGQRVDRVLGVRHQPEHVAGRVADPGDVADRAVGVVALGVAVGDLAACLELVEQRLRRVVAAFAVLHRDREPGAVALVDQLGLAADEAQLGVAQQRPGQQPRLAEDLEAVADPQHRPARGGELRHRLHRRREAGDRAGPQVVAVGEAAGEHYCIDVVQGRVGVPERDRLTACGIEVRDTPAGVEWELVAD